MGNKLSLKKVYQLDSWVERRIADLCRKGSRHMSALATRELGFKVTQCNMRAARRIILDYVQNSAEQDAHKRNSAAHSAPSQ